MRRGRDLALREFNLASEVPVCEQECGIEELTSALDRVLMKRVDQGMLRAKKRRLQSKQPVQANPMDEILVKSLMRLCGAVEDCFAYAHQAAIVRNKATERRVSRAVRESKAKQLFRKKVLEETQLRTKQRQFRIEHNLEAKIREATAAAIANRKEEVRAQRRKRDNRLLEVAEQEFRRISQFEEDRSNRRFSKRRAAKRAQVSQRRVQHREDVAKSLAQLRKGLDQLDAAADAALARRFHINT